MIQASVTKQSKGGITRDIRGGINADKGTVAPTSNMGDKPGSRGVSRDSKATSTTGRGSGRPNGISELHERSAPTSESYTPSTRQTSQEP